VLCQRQRHDQDDGHAYERNMQYHRAARVPLQRLPSAATAVARRFDVRSAAGMRLHECATRNEHCLLSLHVAATAATATTTQPATAVAAASLPFAAAAAARATTAASAAASGALTLHSCTCADTHVVLPRLLCRLPLATLSDTPTPPTPAPTPPPPAVFCAALFPRRMGGRR
jgi:hypothetical protein